MFPQLKKWKESSNNDWYIRNILRVRHRQRFICILFWREQDNKALNETDVLEILSRPSQAYIHVYNSSKKERKESVERDWYTRNRTHMRTHTHTRSQTCTHTHIHTLFSHRHTLTHPHTSLLSHPPQPYVYVYDSSKQEGCLLKKKKESPKRDWYTEGRRPIGWLKLQSFFAKEPLIIGLFCGKWPVNRRHSMCLRHPVLDLSHTRIHTRSLTHTHLSLTHTSPLSHLQQPYVHSHITPTKENKRKKTRALNKTDIQGGEDL